MMEEKVSNVFKSRSVINLRFCFTPDENHGFDLVIHTRYYTLKIKLKNSHMVLNVYKCLYDHVGVITLACVK